MGFYSPKMDLQRSPHEAFPTPNIRTKPSEVDFLCHNMDMRSAKMTPKMAFKTNLDNLAPDCHKSTSQIGGGGGDPRRDVNKGINDGFEGYPIKIQNMSNLLVVQVHAFAVSRCFVQRSVIVSYCNHCVRVMFVVVGFVIGVLLVPKHVLLQACHNNQHGMLYWLFTLLPGGYPPPCLLARLAC